MDRSAVKAIVDREIEPLKERLGIPHWRIIVCYEPAGADGGGNYRRGLCETLVDYNRAKITLNPEAFDDDEQERVRETLVHELLHVVLSPFDMYIDAIRPAVETDPVRQAMAESVRTFAVEQAVINLERMYRGLTCPPGTGDAPVAKTPKKPAKPKPPKPPMPKGKGKG